MPTRPAPPLPPPLLLTQQIVQAPTTTTTTGTNNKNNVLKPPSPTINGIKKAMNGLLLKEKETDIHEYEEITVKSPSRRRSPHRRAPQPPTAVNVTTSVSGYNIAGTTNRLMLGTLGSYTELEGVPFMLNPAFRAIMSNRQVSFAETTRHCIRLFLFLFKNLMLIFGNYRANRNCQNWKHLLQELIWITIFN